MAERLDSTPGYSLGVDLGTTYSAAAIVRGTTVETCVLGTTAAQIPSVVVHRDDAEILTGEAAERRASSEPTRSARDFKRRLGDPVPIIVGGTPYGAEALMAELLEAIVRQVTEREGAPPATIVLTHPANYTDYKRGLLLEAARLAGLPLERVRLITEPEAAAITYAHLQRLDPGDVVAVYDLGGGTFDAAVVRHTTSGFELIGTPEGMERLGGIDFDQAVLAHVDSALDGMVSSADTADPQVVAGQARLRDECRRAKEALSDDTDATITVVMPGIQTEVRITRDELEQMVRPRIAETVKALQRTIASAGLRADDVTRVLLVGGSSRMPLVAQVVRESIDRPVSKDADPKLSIATGAALSAALDPALGVAPPAPGTDSIAGQPAITPGPARRTPSTRRLALLAGVVAASVVVTFVVVSALGDDGSYDASSTSTSASGPGPVPVPVPVPTSVPVPVPGVAPPPAPSSTIVVAVVPTTGESSPLGGAQPFAFHGVGGGSGIPGVAVDAAAPAPLTALAAAPDGAVDVLADDASVLEVHDGAVRVVVALYAGDVPVADLTVASDGAMFMTTPAGVLRVTDGVRELVLDGAATGLSDVLGPLVLDGGGNLYVADNGTARVIRLAPEGGVTLVAGTGEAADAGFESIDGVPAVTADIGVVTGLAIDRNGNLLIGDGDARAVLAVAPDGTIRTVAGGGDVVVDTAGGRDANVSTLATDVAFASVDDIAVDRLGRVYVADSASGAIARVEGDGVVHFVEAGDADELAGVKMIAISSTQDLVFSDGRVVWNLVGAAAHV